MKTIEMYYISGGSQWMTAVTIMAIPMIYFIIETFYRVRTNHEKKRVNHIIIFGSLALTVGLLAQAISVYQVFEFLVDFVDPDSKISPGIMAGGIAVSMIAPIYGIFIFIISFPFWFLLREKINNNRISQSK